jgi:hypothetical protein
MISIQVGKEIIEPIPRGKHTHKGNRILESFSDSLKYEEDKKLFLEMLE